VIPLVYTLRKEVSFIKRRDSWIVFCQAPLNILRVGSNAYAMLQRCDGSKSVHEIAQETGLAEEAALKLCDYFSRKAILKTAPVANRGFFPFVSVIIPAWNRATDIVACLQSVFAQDYPKEKMEVIVVDDNSKENIGDLVRSFPCRLITNSLNRGAAFARNRGAGEAGGEILAFLDNDCEADQAWLRDLVVYFQWDRLGAVGGFVDGYSETTALSRYEKAFSPLNMGNQILLSEGRPRFYVPTCNLLVRKKVFDRTGGMNERLTVGEDVDFCWRMQDEEQVLWYIPAGVVKHKHRLDLGQMLKRRFDYGASEAMLAKLHPDRKKRLRAPISPAVSFLALCLACVLSSPIPLGIPIACVAFDSVKKTVRIRKAGLTVSPSWILLSVLRTHGYFIHSASFYIVRYYLIPVWLLGAFIHSLWLLSLLLILVSGSMDYVLKRPHLSFPTFSLFYVLDHLAYQVGVGISVTGYSTSRYQQTRNS
jgi:mycofactocin system glycosyltransferase